MSISEFIVREQAGHWQVWHDGRLVSDWPSQFEALCIAEALAHAAAARGERARLLVGVGSQTSEFSDRAKAAGGPRAGHREGPAGTGRGADGLLPWSRRRGLRFGYRLIDRGEGCAAQGFSLEDRKPDLDLIEPRSPGRREVEADVGMTLEPAIVLGLVGMAVERNVDRATLRVTLLYFRIAFRGGNDPDDEP
jgi:hypothetical protein